MTTVQSRFEAVHKGYEELAGTRERQLDRQLSKIDELRQEAGIAASDAQTILEDVTSTAVKKFSIADRRSNIQ